MRFKLILIIVIILILNCLSTNNVSAVGPCDSGLKAYWNMEDTGDTLTDISGNGFTARAVGTLSSPNGSINKGRELRGTTADYIYVENLTMPTPSSFSISWWIYPHAATDYNNAIVAEVLDPTTGQSVKDWGAFTFHSATNGYIYVGIDDSSDKRFELAGVLALNQWNHFVFTYFSSGTGPGRALFYRNGVQQGSTIYPDQQFSWGSKFWIADNRAGSGWTTTTDGIIDEVGIWSRALSGPEVSELYSSATGCVAPTATGYPGIVSAPSISDKLDNKISKLRWKVEHNTERLNGFGPLHQKYGYDYFMNKVTSLMPLAGIPTNMGSQPSGAYTLSGSYTMTSQVSFNTPNKRFIFFVPGDLTINGQILVADTTFVAFIVSGNIILGDLGTQVPFTPRVAAKSLEGVYIADGTISTQSSTKQLVASGMFIGWGGFSLNRDVGASYNPTYPSEYFEYRPDFLVNFPKEMGTKKMTWREVVP